MVDCIKARFHWSLWYSQRLRWWFIWCANRDKCVHCMCFLFQRTYTNTHSHTRSSSRRILVVRVHPHPHGGVCSLCTVSRGCFGPAITWRRIFAQDTLPSVYALTQRCTVADEDGMRTAKTLARLWSVRTPTELIYAAVWLAPKLAYPWRIIMTVKMFAFSRNSL